MGTTLWAQQPDVLNLKISSGLLNRALVRKDSVQLRRLTADNLHYYHSSGWLQTKTDLVNDLFNGKIAYSRIDVEKEQESFVGFVGKVNETVLLVAMMNGKEVELHLQVTQIWVWKENHWQLFERRSEKIAGKEAE